MDKRLAYNKNDQEDRFYLHANSVNALQGTLRHAPTDDFVCWGAVDSIIHHLQCEIYILRDEINKLTKKEKNYD